ncbi:UPF0158 family protein [Candidatus Clostridium radicumherbarum]|uniref:UPF0158 family protein n=1 Tax=Candidatus Clostridium radicumherbarum TaxID=3381662 RepID=A0ABW8TNT3_9CLOT
MKKLKIDLELLYQSFMFENEDLCKEYLDTNTGEIINIPEEIFKVTSGKADEKDLDDWQMELLEEAYAVAEDKMGRYILIQNIDISYLNGAIENFVEHNIASEDLKNKLLNVLYEENPLRSFKNVLSDYPEEIDQWYDYEEQKGKEYVIDWLRERNIQIVYPI